MQNQELLVKMMCYKVMRYLFVEMSVELNKDVVTISDFADDLYEEVG